MDSFLETLRQLGPTRMAIMGGILVGLILFFVFVSMRVSAPEMQLLYGDLSSGDAGAMGAQLSQNDIAYELAGDNTEIRVAAADVARARMILAQEGLPNGGSLGYEIFDETSSFGTTTFVQNINQVRALEGELARTIGSLESVRSARVHLVLPQRDVFSREARESQASVFLTMRSGGDVEKEQIEAIRSLVASAVPGLKTSNVSIIDSNGSLLARGGDDDENLMSAKADEKQRNYEKRLVRKIEDQVSQIVGYGNVRATVTAEINYDRISTNEELYDPEGQVVRSTQTTEESNSERESFANQDVTVGNNLPGVGGDLLLDEQPTSEGNRLEEVTNYEISKTIRSVVREVGEVTRLSVAVLVDGSYEKVDGEWNYIPRTEEEIQQITSLVRTAVGFDDTRGDSLEVINMKFAIGDTEDEPRVDDTILGFDKADVLNAANYLAVAVMMILVVMLVLQPMVGRLIETASQSGNDEQLEADLLAARPAAPALIPPEEEEEEEEEVADIPDSMIDIEGIEGKVKAGSIKKIEELIERYPNETVAVIRNWMAGDAS